MMYTINANTFNEIQKVFNRYAKKANAIGLECSLNVVKTYIKEVAIYEVDPVTHTQYKTGTAPIDVMDIELVYPEYKLGDYRVVAVIEHGEDDKNLVYPCTDITIPNKYYHGRGVCEHCGTNHKRVKTVLLCDDTAQELKQVGTGCLKEYTGVTDISLVNAYRALDSIIYNNNCDFGVVGEPTRRYINTFEYLAKCVHIFNELGYNKDNKCKATSLKVEKLTDQDYRIAREVIDFFTTVEDDTLDNFLLNIKNTLTNMYCKPDNGFVAYAYVAYQKEIDRRAELTKKDEELSKISYYGQVGDKIKNIKVTGNCCAGYSSIYGYTFIYKFRDEEGHVFTWKTTVDIDRDDSGTFVGLISGTIKAHEEYAGERQTLLTRCKVQSTLPKEEPETIPGLEICLDALY